MTLITCEECLHKVVCPICFSYKDVLNVKGYCEHFTDKSALEKQIPKKLRVDDEGWLCCPKCDETFKLHNQYHEKNRYCGNCGQKICWGDSE